MRITFFFKIYFFERQCYKNRDLPCADLQSKWPQQAGWGEPGARSPLWVSSVDAGNRDVGHFSLPRTGSAKNETSRGAGRTQTSTPTGCCHDTQQLKVYIITPFAREASPN